MKDEIFRFFAPGYSDIPINGPFNPNAVSNGISIPGSYIPFPFISVKVTPGIYDVGPCSKVISSAGGVLPHLVSPAPT